MHCPLQYFSSNKQSSQIFSLRITVLSGKQLVIGVHMRPGGPRPSQSKNLCNEYSPFLELIFFEKVFCCIKTGKVEVNCCRKMYSRYSYAYKPCYCPGRIYIELGPWHFEIFAILSCQIQVKTKKSHYLSAVPMALSHMLNPSLVNGYCIAFVKGLDEDLS